jgi:hypothetical protein
MGKKGKEEEANKICTNTSNKWVGHISSRRATSFDSGQENCTQEEEKILTTPKSTSQQDSRLLDATLRTSRAVL